MSSVRIKNLWAAALAASDADLHALAAAASESPLGAPGFLAWLEHVADWDRGRQAGMDYALQSPGAAITTAEEAAGIAAAMMLGAMFAKDAPCVATLFNGIVMVLTGGGSRQLLDDGICVSSLLRCGG